MRVPKCSPHPAARTANLLFKVVLCEVASGPAVVEVKGSFLGLEDALLLRPLNDQASCPQTLCATVSERILFDFSNPAVSSRKWARVRKRLTDILRASRVHAARPRP